MTLSLPPDPAFQHAILRWLVEFAAQGILVTDGELTVVSWNAWLETHSGRTAGEVLGRPLLTVWPDLVERGLEPYYRDALEGRASVVSQALHGHVVPLHAKPSAAFVNMPQSGVIAPLLDGSRVIGTITVIEDATERMLRESELRSQIRALDAARASAEAAVQAKDEFFATLSHELRTPLTSVLGWAQILRAQTVDADTLQHALDVIGRNAAAQLRLIDDMLDVSRILAGKLRLELGLVDLVTVAAAAADAVSPAVAAKGLTLRTAIDRHIPRLFGDQDRLQQIISNLLSNAVKFTESGGTIELRLEPMDDRVALIVRDTGQGIDPSFLPHVFERFRQADASSTRRQGGLGLGLALVRHLTELHGGTVQIESAGRARGTMVTVTLPTRATRERTAAAPAVTSPIQPALLTGVDALLVDDDSDSLELLTIVLEAHGARATAVGSSAEALAVLGRGTGRLPTVVLTDLNLPGEDGFTLIQKIRSLYKERGGELCAIAVTASTRPEDRARALASGFDLYVAKPLDPEALTAAIADRCVRAH